MSTINTTSPDGAPLSIRMPDEAEVDRLAYILAWTGAYEGDRGDAALIRSRVTDAQRRICREHLILALNSEV